MQVRISLVFISIGQPKVLRNGWMDRKFFRRKRGCLSRTRHATNYGFIHTQSSKQFFRQVQEYSKVWTIRCAKELFVSKVPAE